MKNLEPTDGVNMQAAYEARAKIEAELTDLLAMVNDNADRNPKMAEQIEVAVEKLFSIDRPSFWIEYAAEIGGRQLINDIVRGETFNGMI